MQNIVSHFGTGIPNFVFTLVIDAWSYPRQDQIKKEGHKLKMTQDVKLMINLIFDAFGWVFSKISELFQAIVKCFKSPVWGWLSLFLDISIAEDIPRSEQPDENILWVISHLCSIKYYLFQNILKFFNSHKNNSLNVLVGVVVECWHVIHLIHDDTVDLLVKWDDSLLPTLSAQFILNWTFSDNCNMSSLAVMQTWVEEGIFLWVKK